MIIEIEHIEDVTGRQLRRLPTHREPDIYSTEDVSSLEEDDILTSEEGGFMLGYLGESYN